MASTPSVSIPKKIGAHEAAFGVVRAWRFELIADVGEPTGVFGFTKDGRPGIGLFDGVSNPPAAEMILEKEGPAVRLNDDNGRARIKIGLRKCGPFITITQRDKPQNVLRLVLALDDDTSILKVVIYDSRGRPMEFVKKYQKRFAARRYEEILGKFVATRKKAAFIRALSQYFDVHDRDLAEAMWRSATSDDEGHGGAAREAEDSHGRSRRSQGQKMAKDAEAWLRRQLDGLGGPASWRRG